MKKIGLGLISTIPFPRKDETVYGYFTRIRLLSGSGSPDTLSRTLFQSSSSAIHSKRGEVKLDHFEKALNELGFEFTQSADVDMSFGAIVYPFVTESLAGRKVTSHSRYFGSNECRKFGLNSIRIKWVPTSCVKCIETDIKKLGFSYFRRSTLISGVTVCPIHRVVLANGCSSCDRRYSYEELPWTTCPSCGFELNARKLGSDMKNQIRLRYAEAVECVYAGRIRGPLDSEKTIECIKKLVPSAGKPFGKRLLNLVEKRAGQSLLSELKLLPKPYEEFSWPTAFYAKNFVLVDIAAQLIMYSVLAGGRSELDLFSKRFPERKKLVVSSKYEKVLYQLWNELRCHGRL